LIYDYKANKRAIREYGMNCHLTDKERKTGNRCRSWDCIPCKEFGLSVNDTTVTNIHTFNKRLRSEISDLKIALKEFRLAREALLRHKEMLGKIDNKKD
jgi:hypothetical protein